MNITTLRARAALAVIATAAAVAATACGSTTNTTDSGMTPSDTASGQSASGSTAPGHGMPGMEGTPSGDGLRASAAGMTLIPNADTLAAGQDTTWSFRIVGSNGNTVTEFVPEQTKLMHLYLIRNDVTGFQHLHPTMTGDGTWSAPIAALETGPHRAYTQFSAIGGDSGPVEQVLSALLYVPGEETSVRLPPAAPTTGVDGYTLGVDSQLTAGQEGQLSLTISRDGQPVTDLQPYLDTHAHLTAIRAQTLAFAHLHPQGTVDGDNGGPRLDFGAMLPKAGPWRLFIQFQTGGALHTAAITLNV